ncbi:signal peptidase [Curtobacterium flaccumfaciens]|uniref:Signal peptidase I n=1 Tax=Curtobacterium salicis TaxID=1779862 RepID=A0ABX0TEP2_9MICO|nr:signal peptidase I [Curtobacterium sp. WW7]NII42628.1 signal peptidase [Curtobacterium sp. WW7]
MRSSSWLRFTAVLVARGLVAALVGVAIWGVAPLALGWHSTTVMTGSMQPSLVPGDVVVSRPVPTSQIRAGQVLLFPDPDHAGVLRLHRLHQVDADGALVTKGDANPADDSSTVRRTAVVGVGYLRVPLVGTPVVWLAEHRVDRLVVLALAITLLVGLAVLPPVPSGASTPDAPLGRRGRHRAGRSTRTRTRAVVVAVLSAVVGIALPAPAAAAAFGATTTTPVSALATAVARPVTGLTCTDSGSGVTIGWTPTGVAPERFSILVDGVASGITTGPDAAQVALRASDFFQWKTSTIGVRTDLTDSWTATSNSTVRITTIRLFGLGRTSCAR